MSWPRKSAKIHLQESLEPAKSDHFIAKPLCGTSQSAPCTRILVEVTCKKCLSSERVNPNHYKLSNTADKYERQD